MPECVVDPEQPPASAAGMPDQIQGQGFRGFKGFRRFLAVAWRAGALGAGRNHLDAPDLVIHESWSAAQRRPLLLRPPLPALIPAHRFGADRVLPAAPPEFHGFARGVADDVYRLAEHAHGCLRKPTESAEYKRLFEYVFEQLQSTPGLGQNLDGCGLTAA